MHHAAESVSTTSFREQCSYTLLSCPKHLLLQRRKPETLTCLLLPHHQYLKHHPPLSLPPLKWLSNQFLCFHSNHFSLSSGHHPLLPVSLKSFTLAVPPLVFLPPTPSHCAHAKIHHIKIQLYDFLTQNLILQNESHVS